MGKQIQHNVHRCLLILQNWALVPGFGPNFPSAEKLLK